MPDRTMPFESVLCILDNLDAHVFVADTATHEVLFVNRVLREARGVPVNPAGMKCWELMRLPSAASCDQCPLSALLSPNAPDTVQTGESFSACSGRYYRNTDSLIEWVGGKLAHLHQAVDITHEKQLQSSLIEAKSSAEKADRAKSDFLSRMNHEIRTPLNAIIGMTNIAQSSAEPEKIKACLGTVADSAKQLKSIVSDVLDVAKIEANSITLIQAPFDLFVLLDELVATHGEDARKKRQWLQVNMPPTTPRYYRGDRERLSQVIGNLLSNAVKFAPEGGRIKISLCEKERVENLSTLEVSVADNGIGISPEQQAGLFRHFEQADGSKTRHYGGTGLGLGISKSLVEMMNGQIYVTSKLCQGSTFTFTVKLELLEETLATKRILEDISFKNLRVLFLDRRDCSRNQFVSLMADFGIECDSAAGWEEALAIPDSPPYTVVLAEECMIGGEDAKYLQSVKNRLGGAALVMLSQAGNRRPTAGERVQGVEAVMATPLAIAELLTFARAWADRAQLSAAEDGRGGRFSGYVALLAEDLEISSKILMQELAFTGMETDWAQNGREALEMFQNDPERYDIILMDVHMPLMDGIEATSAIRALEFEWAKAIPILALTASALEEELHRTLECGMTENIIKPVKPQVLFNRMAMHLERRPRRTLQKAGEGAREPVPTSSEAELSYRGGAGLTEHYIDWRDGLFRLHGNKKLYATLLQSFQKGEHFSQLVGNIEAGDMEKSAASAHAVKGMAANLSITALADCAALLESQIKSGLMVAETVSNMKRIHEKTLECIPLVIEEMQGAEAGVRS